MTEPTVRARVGFVSGNDHWGPHYDHLLALVPRDVVVEFKGLGMPARSQYDLAGMRDDYIARASQLARAQGWQAMTCTGAPTQVQNPGLLEGLRAALDIPVTTALHASGTALRSMGLRRVLLLTPFRRSMNDRIGEYLATLGVEVALAERDFQEVTEASVLPPDAVYDFAVASYQATPGVEAIYFQGAVLDPVAVVERLEADLNVPVIASNPAMLWHTLSMLGIRMSIPNTGCMLRDWPALITV